MAKEQLLVRWEYFSSIFGTEAHCQSPSSAKPPGIKSSWSIHKSQFDYRLWLGCMGTYVLEAPIQGMDK